jgi:predicted alpha/beta-hydrolase family hydrolase
MPVSRLGNLVSRQLSNLRNNNAGESGEGPRRSTPGAQPRDRWEEALSSLPPVGRIFQKSAAPTALAQSALASATATNSDYILFAPPAGRTPQRGLIFLGGAKVQEEAYAPLAKALAERGIATAIVRSPLDLPFIAPLNGRRLKNAAEALRALQPDLSLIVGGHSAGGFVASGLDNLGADDTLLLNSRASGSLGASPRAEVQGLAIFGGRDGLIDAAERAETQRLLPSIQSVTLEALDHDFARGLYGSQDGDLVTSASTQALIDQVADLIAARLAR